MFWGRSANAKGERIVEERNGGPRRGQGSRGKVTTVREGQRKSRDRDDQESRNCDAVMEDYNVAMEGQRGEAASDFDEAFERGQRSRARGSCKEEEDHARVFGFPCYFNFLFYF